MSWLQNLISEHPYLVYPTVFFTIIAEGDFFLIFLGLLIREKYFAFWKIYLIAVSAATVHDILFWAIGRYVSKFNKKRFLFFNLEKKSEILEKVKNNIGFLIFFSKFVWNFNRIILLSAGYLKTSFKTFIKYSFSASLIWPVVLISLGYLFADQTEVFKKKFETASIIILTMVTFFIIFQLWVKKIFQSYLLENKKNKNHQNHL